MFLYIWHDNNLIMFNVCYTVIFKSQTEEQEENSLKFNISGQQELILQAQAGTL